MQKKYVQKSPKKLEKVREEKYVIGTGRRLIAPKMAKQNTFDKFVFEQLVLLRAFESATTNASRKVVKKYAPELAFVWWRLTDLISRHGPDDDRLRLTPPVPLPYRPDIVAIRGARAGLVKKLRVKNARKQTVSILAPFDCHLHSGFDTRTLSKLTLIDQPLDRTGEKDPPRPRRAKSKRMN